MEQFFANPFAQTAGDALYASRDEAEWRPAPDALTFHVPAPAGAPARFIGMMPARASSADEAIAQLGKLVWANLGAARRRGQLSHSLYVRTADLTTARPASNSRRTAGESVDAFVEPVEVLAIDSWTALDGCESITTTPPRSTGSTAPWQARPPPPQCGSRRAGSPSGETVPFRPTPNAPHLSRRPPNQIGDDQL
jgi:hypothetical protein